MREISPDPARRIARWMASTRSGGMPSSASSSMWSSISAPPMALAEDLQEAPRLPANLPELPPLLHDQGPADDGEDAKQEEDELRDGAGIEDELDDAGVQASISLHSGLLLGRNSRRKLALPDNTERARRVSMI